MTPFNQSLKSLWLQGVAFNAEERSRFLNVLTTQMEAGLTDAKVYANLYEYGYSAEVRELARQSLAGQLATGLFTGNWDKNGYWPRRAGLLLQVAEKHRVVLIAPVADVASQDRELPDATPVGRVRDGHANASPPVFSGVIGGEVRPLYDLVHIGEVLSGCLGDQGDRMRHQGGKPEKCEADRGEDSFHLIYSP